MEKLFGIIGIISIIGVVYLTSPNKKSINWKSVGLAFLSQILLAFLLIKTPLWKLVEVVSNGMTKLLGYANEGINFVFGGISDNFVFFINSLLPIVFISSLIGLLFHFGILQKVVKGLGLTIAKLFKIDPIVAVNGVSNCLLGQSEALFVTKNYLPSAKESTIFACMVGGMTSISASVIGLYVGYGASMDWILVSIPLTVFSTFTLTQIYMPSEYVDYDKLEVSNEGVGENFIETMVNYGNSGFKGVIGVTVALLVFLSLVALVNGVLGALHTGLSLESIFGVLFYPLGLLMGVSHEEIMAVASMLATKLVTNEAVAFAMPVFSTLSAKASAMQTIALCGFSGFGSIAILLGGFSAVAPSKCRVVAKLGIKALLIASLVNIMSGAVVGLFL